MVQRQAPGPNLLAGLPDQVELPPATVPGPSIEYDGLVLPSTPLGKHTSKSTPPISPTASIHSRIKRAASDFRQLKLSDTPQSEREWTVFGQLMDNRGEMRIPGNQIGHGIGSARISTPVSSSNNVLDGNSVESPILQSLEDSDINITRPNLYRPVSSDYDSDDLLSRVASPAPTSISREPKLPVLSLPRLFSLSPLQRNILKCSIAYLVASLFTFVPLLSGLIADITSAGESLPSPSGHMVATIVVYFNPAKTVGAMLEADRFCLLGVLFAAFASLGSMSMYWWLEVRPGLEWLADVLVILWIGVSISGLAWMRVWMANPSFNPACSMTCIILFIVVVREGGVETLLQVSLIIFTGAIVSNIACFSLWRQTATANLQANMTDTLDSFATLLQMLVDTFLLEEPLHPLSQEILQKAVDNHQASFTSLKKNLWEARSEMLSGVGELGDKDLAIAYENAVDSMNRLAQHLNGLRSGSRLQYDLAKAHHDGLMVHRKHAKQGKMQAKGKLADVFSDGVHETDDSTELLNAVANMFGDLVDELGSPMKALSTACIASLTRVKETFVVHKRNKGEDIGLPQNYDQLMENIERALFTFDSTSNHAVMRLYRRSDAPLRSSFAFNMSAGDKLMSSVGNDENVFLVYFFTFTLQEFAAELLLLIDAMCRIITRERIIAARGNLFKRCIVGALKSLRANFIFKTDSNPVEQRRSRMGMTRRLSSYLLPWAVAKRRRVHFPKVRPHAPNTIQTPGGADMSFSGRVQQSLWAIGARLKEPDMKYAFKVGMASSILAGPAFFETTRPVFTEYRGEWALISFFGVISPTVGATNFLTVHRILGTLIGAAAAAAVWSAFPENPVVLAIFGFFFSIPCFHYIVAKPKYAGSARFSLLTYNLTCLYCYNIRMNEVSVIDIALHRTVAVAAGGVWAGLVSRYWWPTEARRELSRSLGEFCLNMGWLYTRLAAYNSFPNGGESGDTVQSMPTENTSLLKSLSNDDIHEFMSMELHLQIKIIELQGLLAETEHEPRLKGPFPVKLYRSILTSLQNILDKLHSMRCVTSRDEWQTNVHRDFIIPVNKERREMVGNIILYFSVLASAFRLKAPLPPYLPPADRAQQRLVDAIRELDVIKNREMKGSRQLLFFAYVLTMKGVIQELDYLGRTLQDAFGVIGQNTEEFEALFRGDASLQV